MIRPPARDAQAGAAAAKSMWLISFTDLMSLMLGFFVLLYGMTQPDRAKFHEIARGLSARSTASGHSDRVPTPNAVFNGAVIEANPRLASSYLHTLLKTAIREDPALAAISTRLEDDRVVIAIPRAELFTADGRTVAERGRRVLFALGDALGRSGNRVEIVSIAEPLPGAAGAAWEAALIRSAATAAAMRGLGYASDLVARAATGTGGPAGGVELVVREREK